MKKNSRIVVYWAFILLIGIMTVSCAGLLGKEEKKSPKVEEKKPVKTPTPKPTVQPTPQAQKPDAKTFIDQGKTQRRAGKYPEAIASFEDALKLESNNAEAARLLQETKKERDDLVAAHMKQGLEFMRQENLQAALQEWNKILVLDPGNKEAADYKQRTQQQLDALKK